MSTAVDASAEAAQIQVIAEPFMWVQWADTGWFGQYVLEGVPKPSREWSDSSLLREDLLHRVDDLIAALAAAGWQLMDRFDLSFRTEIDNFRQTLDGVLMVPSEEKGVTAEVSLRLGRARR